MQSPDERAEGGCSDDAFLGGALAVLQPKRGYRAGADAIMLAAAVVAEPDEHVLDVGAGVGTVGLALARRLPGVQVTGLEIQQHLTTLAESNALRNGLEGVVEVLGGDISRPPEAVMSRQFDHVVSNPPYFDPQRTRPAPDRTRALARNESDIQLSAWVRFCCARVRPGGSATFIHPAERLTEVLSGLEPEAGGATIFPLWPQRGRSAKRLIIQATKNSRAPLRIAGGMVLHQQSGEYTEAAEIILRAGGGLSLSGD